MDERRNTAKATGDRHEPAAAARTKLDVWYGSRNLPVVEIAMDPETWTSLRQEEPAGGACNHAYECKRYRWHEAASVTLSGSVEPFNDAVTIDRVGVRKKSYCSSKDSVRPSLKISLNRYVKDDSRKQVIGSSKLTLNNSKSDPLIVRQCVGYRLIRDADLPGPRCNLAEVRVNGEYIGTYVNVEPIKKQLVRRCFGDADGNLYELEHQEDLIPEIDLCRIEYKGFRKDHTKDDLRAVREVLKTGSIAALDKVVPVQEFLRFWSMEALLKHWDGYTYHRNNTYIYNSRPDSEFPRLVFFHWGIDEILQTNQRWLFHANGRVANVLWQDPATRARLAETFNSIRDQVLSRSRLEEVVLPYVGTLEEQVNTVGGRNEQPTIIVDAIRHQLRQAAEANPPVG